MKIYVVLEGDFFDNLPLLITHFPSQQSYCLGSHKATRVINPAGFDLNQRVQNTDAAAPRLVFGAIPHRLIPNNDTDVAVCAANVPLLHDHLSIQ